MKPLLKNLIWMFALTLLASSAFGQGMTTAGMNGQITDESGETLIGATVIAVHIPTGSQFASISDADGYWRIPNMSAGGPYTITISYVGYENFKQEGISLSLGQTFKLDASMSQTAVDIAEVLVVGSRFQYDLFDGNVTGTETVIQEEQINTIPSVSRDLSDFTKLTPQASITSQGGINIAGSNSRYNSFFIDGAMNNDVFGLADNGTNGGQIGISPFSVDAIEQFQVVIAPYDVRHGGFTGGGINAVTRMGSNQVEGSAYYFMRSDGLAGKTPVNDESLERKKLDKFNANTYGFRVGTPIVKNKLFLFVNAELQREETPRPFDFASYEGDASTQDLADLVTKLNGYGYDPGGYGDQISSLKSDKVLIRLDWNISDKHKVMIRNQYTKGVSMSPSRSASDNLIFGNSGIDFPSLTNALAAELKSNISNTMSNKLTVGYTAVRDNRNPMGSNFPRVYVSDGGGDINFGSEEYSTANELNQDIFTLTDNLQIYKGKHTITVGTHNELYKMYNVFIRQNFGTYYYDSLSGFMNDVLATDYYRSYSAVDDITGDGTKAAAEFTAMQLGFYAQDEFQVSNEFKLTYGVRIDIPMFLTTLNTDQSFNDNTIPLIEAEGYNMDGAKAGQMPSAQIMFSPRVGFNWDVLGDKSLQLRGGVGIFTSRIPFVWPGASYNNNGLTLGNVSASDVAFIPQWDQQYDKQDLQPGTPDVPSGDMNLFVKNFKYPQVFRTSLALDKKLPWGMIGTLEGMFTKTLNNVSYMNYNIKPSSTSLTGTPDDRPIYDRYDRVDGTYGYMMVGDNTNKGYTYNLTVQLQKPFVRGFAGSLAYTYGAATSVFDGTSSQNSSQWRYMANSRGRNYVGLTRSDFDMGHRVVGFLSYRVQYLGHASTTFSLFYNGQSGRPFSYVYNNYRLTDQDSKDMDLIYIPAQQSDIIFADAATANQQWQDLDEFIKGDKYLNANRGKYSERNGPRLPFENIIDFKIAQDIFTDIGDKRNTLQITLDIFNLGNLINKDWGRMYYATYYDKSRLIEFEDFQADGTTPTFSFDRPKNDEPYDIDDGGIRSSRWQAQLGFRYIF